MPSRWRRLDLALARFIAQLRAELSARTVEFYGGLLLVGAAPLRWAIVGGVLVLHAIVAPRLWRQED
jgi:hypothetical protein